MRFVTPTGVSAPKSRPVGACRDRVTDHASEAPVSAGNYRSTGAATSCDLCDGIGGPGHRGLSSRPRLNDAPLPSIHGEGDGAAASLRAEAG